MNDHRYDVAWLAELRSLAGIPAGAQLNIMRDYGVLGEKTGSILNDVGQIVRTQWTGGYIADWYELADAADLEMQSEQELLVQNVPVLVRKWSAK